jgi:predicted PolB exonuclease-like 3'-5' exonuclease
MQTTIYFDVETAQVPDSELIVPEFEAARNLKDPDKIKASIAEKEAQWRSELALSAVTGQILTIGTLSRETFSDWSFYTTERAMIEAFWAAMAAELRAGNTLVGFCCKSFDLPFLIRRSFKHGLQVPACIWNNTNRYFSDQIVDIANKWSCGSRDPRDWIGLDALAKFLGVGAKTGTGKDFAALWDTDRDAAIAYLRNDLQLTKACYERMML